MPDLVMIGAGPAEISVGVYAARKMMGFVVLSKDVGGRAATICTKLAAFECLSTTR